MRGLLIVLLVGSGLVACGKNSEPPPPSSGTFGAKPESGPRGGTPAGGDDQAVGPAAEARELFTKVCAQCHGLDGSGNGPASEMINPKPRNYTDAAWQASVSDADIEKIILLGGQGVGKSPTMPAQVQLKKQPEVLHELVKIVRGFGAKK